MEITEEQALIVKHIDFENVVVQSKAGVGKSATAIFMSEKYPKKNILLLTYNKRLRMETKNRLKDIHKNMEVHSFHSYSVNYYDKEAYTDSGMAKIINSGIKSSNKLKYNIFIIDEAQDLTILYLRIINKIIKDSCFTDFKICVFGDQRQSIYGYNGADQRYLANINKILYPNSKWVHLQLTETFRLTINMTKFLNIILDNSKESEIVTKKPLSGLIRYVIANCFNDGPFKELKYYLEFCSLKYEDIMVIAPSLKKGPVNLLSNRLTSVGIPVHYPTSDSQEIDNTITKNKILFCTMHQSKGLERKAIILFNFDESYLMFNKSSNTNEMSNEMYVALTRSSLFISLLRHSTNDDLEFFENHKEQFIKNCTIIPIIYDKPKKLKKKDLISGTESILSVTNVIKYVTYDIIDNILDCIETKVIEKSGIELNLPTKVYQQHQDLYEQVSDISGTGIPAYYEYINTGTTTILELEDSAFSGRKFKTFKFSSVETGYSKNSNIKDNGITADMFLLEDDDINKPASNISGTLPTILPTISPSIPPPVSGKKMEDFQRILYLSNKFLAISSGVDAKMQQIENYNWITSDVLDICMKRMSKVMSSDAEYEVPCNGNLVKKSIAGYIDAVDHGNKIVYEFKCTQNIEKVHLIQVFLYNLINESESRYKNYKYHIFNIRTGEIIEITKKESIDQLKIDNAIKALFKTNKEILNIEEFLKYTLSLMV